MIAKGDRIELVSTSDPFTRLQPGARGTVALVDSVGTIHVRWDEGSQLGLVPREDSWRAVCAHERAGEPCAADGHEHCEGSPHRTGPCRCSCHLEPVS